MAYVKTLEHIRNAGRASGLARKGKPTWNAGTRGVMKAWNKGKTNIYSKETLEKISEVSKKNWANPEYREKMLGRKSRAYTPEHREKLRQSFLGENNPLWKGDDVGYGGIHDWVRSQLGTPNFCSDCGKTGLVGHQIHWHNLSGEYKRDVTDWRRVCAKCHKTYHLMKLK